MAHSKEHMLREIQAMGGQIAVLLQYEGVKITEDYFLLTEEDYQLRADFIRPAFHWLEDVFKTEFTEVLRIKRMQPSEIWARYKQWGCFEEHREVLLLNKALNALRMKLITRTRPDFFKKSKRHAKSNKTRTPTSGAGLEAQQTTE